jgi:molybdate transport system regulatory protein
MTRAPQHQLSIRIDLAGGGRIGPGKVALLEAIGETGSISAAGRAMSMSYRRAWQLVEDLNRSLGNPVVETSAGGAGGGGARLTHAGLTLIERYRAVEQAASTTAHVHLIALDRIVARKAPDENAV